MKYKVTVQPIVSDADDVPQELQDGILCDGYMLIADFGDRTAAITQHMKTLDIINALPADDILDWVKCTAMAQAAFRELMEERAGLNNAPGF